MLLLYLQDYDTDNLRELAELCRDSFGMDWETRVEACRTTPEMLLKQIKAGDAPALFIMEDAQREQLNTAVLRIREQNPMHYLVLLICSAVDALHVRPPYYRPTGFLMRPIDKANIRLLLENIYYDYSDANSGHGGIFPIKVRGTVYPIPYSKILFFESSLKKIIARTDTQEYEFYGSLEEISRNAPGFFLRTHKGFCVNMKQVSAVNFNERTISMSDESVIPFSRTFKPELTKALASYKEENYVQVFVR